MSFSGIMRDKVKSRQMKIACEHELCLLNEKMPKWVLLQSGWAYDVEHYFRLSSGTRARRPIILQALPKSGGSWLSNVIAESTSSIKVQKRYIKKCDPSGEIPWSDLYPHFTDMTDLDDGVLEKYEGAGVLLHTHFALTEENIQKISKIDAYCVFLKRNIPDVMVSLYYHLLGRDGEWKDKLTSLNTKQGLDEVLEHFLDAFVLYDRRMAALQAMMKGSCMIHYEEAISDPCNYLYNKLSEIELKVSKKWMKKVVNKFQKPDVYKEDLHSALKLRSASSIGNDKYLTVEQMDRIKVALNST